MLGKSGKSRGLAAENFMLTNRLLFLYNIKCAFVRMSNSTAADLRPLSSTRRPGRERRAILLKMEVSCNVPYLSA